MWGPGSDIYGRKIILIITMFFYAIFLLGQSLAKNTETLLVTRFISGFFGCAPLTSGFAIMADIWDPEGRGIAVSIISAGVFLGMSLGPITGGL